MDSDDDNENDITAPDPDDDTVFIGPPKLIAIIGDEDTCCGFMLGGIGEISAIYDKPNYYVVDRKTDDFKLEIIFRNFLRREDIGLILITREAAEKISPVIKAYKGIDPVVMIIPGHNGPYEIDLPIAVQEIEDRRNANASSRAGSRRGSAGSTTSVKTIQSHGALSARASTHSMKSIRSNKSLF